MVKNPELISNTSFFLLKELWINYDGIHLILSVFIFYFLAFSNQIRNLHAINTAKRQIFEIRMDGWKCSENVQLDCTDDMYLTTFWHTCINKKCSEMIYSFFVDVEYFRISCITAIFVLIFRWRLNYLLLFIFILQHFKKLISVSITGQNNAWGKTK